MGIWASLLIVPSAGHFRPNFSSFHTIFSLFIMAIENNFLHRRNYDGSNSDWAPYDDRDRNEEQRSRRIRRHNLPYPFEAWFVFTIEGGGVPPMDRKQVAGPA